MFSKRAELLVLIIGHFFEQAVHFVQCGLRMLSEVKKGSIKIPLSRTAQFLVCPLRYSRHGP